MSEILTNSTIMTLLLFVWWLFYERISEKLKEIYGEYYKAETTAVEMIQPVRASVQAVCDSLNTTNINSKSPWSIPLNDPHKLKTSSITIEVLSSRSIDVTVTHSPMPGLNDKEKSLLYAAYLKKHEEFMCSYFGIEPNG